MDTDGKKTTLKSNQVGKFPPIPHSDKPTTVYHKTADGDLKHVGQIDGDKGQHYSLLTRLERFVGSTGPDKPSEKPETAPPFQPVEYQVNPGDSLGKIVEKFKKLKVSAEDIKRFNNLESDLIFPGEILSINAPKTGGPSRRVQPKKAAPKPGASPDQKTGTAKPAAKKAPPPAGTPTTFARSKEGDGPPMAMLPPDHRRAPWMEAAMNEARRFKGKQEAIIERERNYAREAKTGQTTMTAEEIAPKKWNYHAWCAAFVNWCLMRAGYTFDEYPDGADRGRAHGFYEIHGEKLNKKDKERPLVRNPLFRQIDQPIFGCIAVQASRSKHGHHVGFVYAKSNDNNLVLLGGNQDDRIRFSTFNINEEPAKEIIEDGERVKKKAKRDHLMFFVPTAYYEQAQIDDKMLEVKTDKQLNKEFGIDTSRNVNSTEGSTT